MNSLFVLVLVAATCGTGLGSHQYGHHHHHHPTHKHEPCDICEEEDFLGFGTPSSKCGCCPWPCCCKCFESPGEEPVCRSVLDIMWVLDSSGSIGDIDWIVAKQFVSDVVGELDDIGLNQLVAMTTYSTNATLEWCYDGIETTSKSKLNAAVEDLILKGAFTNTVEALQKATGCQQSPSNRPEAPNVCIVMTDGRTTHNVAQLPDVAAKFRQYCDKMVVIGVTTTLSEDELKLIAGPGGSIFEVDDYQALQSILSNIRKEICVGGKKPMEEKCFCCCTPAQFFGGGGAYYYTDPYDHHHY